MFLLFATNFNQVQTNRIHEFRPLNIFMFQASFKDTEGHSKIQQCFKMFNLGENQEVVNAVLLIKPLTSNFPQILLLI